MKPVEKGSSPKKYSGYSKAKVDLISRLGSQCSYCEASKDPQDLHVEHIYPRQPHPELELEWENFLLSCNTCNTYKNLHLGNGRHKELETRYIWPHLDNTFKAYAYHEDGRVEMRRYLRKSIKEAASLTRDLVGLMRSPAKTETYADAGVAYDGISKRRELWSQAEGFRSLYISRPTSESANAIADCAVALGYFSIWMEVFSGQVEVRQELIRAFKADRKCFTKKTDPKKKGRC